MEKFPPRIGPEDEKVLGRIVRGGGPEAMLAVMELVKANLKLVDTVAGRYKGKGVPFEDLQQEGRVGLMQAAVRFDPERGCTFGTVAVWWIRARIAATLDSDSATVRIPIQRRQDLRNLKKARNELMRRGCEPTLPALAKTMGVSAITVQTLLALEARGKDIALDAPLDIGGRRPDFLRTSDEEGAGASSEQAERKHRLAVALSKLPPRAEFIVRQHHGIDCPQPIALREIARRLDLRPDTVLNEYRYAVTSIEENLSALAISEAQL